MKNKEINLNAETPEQTKKAAKSVKVPKTVTRAKATLYMAVTAVITVAVTLAGVFAVLNGSSFGKTVTKLYALNKIVQGNFTGTVDAEKLDDALLEAYVDTLEDDYGFYKSAEKAESVSNSLKGENYGIGITVVYEKSNQWLYVLRVYQNSPAEKAGLKGGDCITAVDGATVAELGNKKAVAAIKKEKGSTVKLTVLRENNELELSAICGDYVEQSVFYRMIGTKAYIEITGFNDATVPQFKEALAFVKAQKATGVIFDLRDNGGGTVDSAAEILDLLLGECDIISVEYKNSPKTVLYKSNAEKLELPMTVIANSETASAAELFTAALRDAAGAKIVGNTTYGKGVMQRTYFLQDGSCVRLTVAKFYPPSGICFDKIGITPDVEVNFTEEQQSNYYKLGDSDPYIQAALNILN